MKLLLKAYDTAKNGVMYFLLGAGFLLCLLIYLEVGGFIYWSAFQG